MEILALIIKHLIDILDFVQILIMEIIAFITDYLIDDLHFDYDDGSSEWHDATELKISKPKNLKDTILFIYHKFPPSEENIWRKIGLRVIITTKEKIIPIKSHKMHFIYSDEVLISEL